MVLFRWEEIDHRLVTLKLVQLGEEMRSRAKAAESRIEFENRLNMNGNAVPSLVLRMKEEHADEWARILYEVYCQVWQTQGNVKSAAFVRAVRVRIVSMIEIRARSIAREFSRSIRVKKLPFHLRTAHLNKLSLRMRQLQGRWHRRLEIEAKECEHFERRKRIDIPPQPVEALRRDTFSKPSGSAPIKHGLGSAEQTTSATKGSQTMSPAYSVPLSAFESKVGNLMVEARATCSTKYLPQAEIIKIADVLDNEKLPVRENLEREAARHMAEYNQRHSKAALKTWNAALGHPQFRRAIRKRFSRAEEKYRRSSQQLS